MADEESGKGPPKNALYRRYEQLQRWKGSPTDLEPPKPKRPEKRVKFADGCMFLAACSSADIDEVKSFLDRGADINTANIDGLTALHQACIDQNMNMVEFLVENDADVNVCDNEGWTPLHATASCGFTEIARYLLDTGGNVAAVNNDGDLPIDICEDDRMEKLLQEEMDKRGIDAEAARKAEEEMMLADANQWFNNRTVKEKPHTQTGATALHVSAAKGYVKVMNVLIQAGANLNAQDLDGWTPLHAAAHWGQEEACKLLAESMCDMEMKNSAGQTPFDVADPDVLNKLEELKKRQATLRDKADLQSDIIQTKAPPRLQRRSSVTRMSGDQKQNVMMKTSEQEKAVLGTEEGGGGSSSSSGSEGETSDSETGTTEKKNAINKQSKLEIQAHYPLSPTPHSHEANKQDMPRIEELPESAKTEGDSVFEEPNAENDSKETPGAVVGVPSLLVPSSDPAHDLNERYKGLRKTGSSSLVSDITSLQDGRDRVQRSASTPRIPLDNKENSDKTIGKDSIVPTPETDTTQSRLDRRRLRYGFLSPAVSYTPRTYGSSSYVPYYRRQQLENERKEKEKADKEKQDQEESKKREKELSERERLKKEEEEEKQKKAKEEEDRVRKEKEEKERERVRREKEEKEQLEAKEQLERERLEKERKERQEKERQEELSKRLEGDTKGDTSPTITVTTPTRRIEPVQNEEAELQRKAKAKRSRETRRPTQGVTRDDIVAAEEVLRATREKEEKDKPSSSISTTTTTTTTTSTTENGSIDSIRRPRTWEDRKDDETRSSGRRSRIPELSSSTSSIPSNMSDTSTSRSSYHTPSTRNSLISTVSNSEPSLTGGPGVTRSTSLRRARITEPEKVEEEKKEDKKEDNKEHEPKQSSAMRARRRRQERHPTGPCNPNKESENKEETEESKEEDKKEERTSYGSSSRYTSRPTSAYSELSKSTSSLDTDYKRLYDDEKVENEKIKKELAQTKRDLEQAQRELERALRKRDSDAKQEKRSLERKVSELEEELKRMREDNDRVKQENQALIRVISRLSR